MKPILYNTDSLIELLGPYDRASNAVITSGTCTGYIFDDRKDTRLTAAAITAATVLAVEDPSQWVANADTAFVWIDTKTWFDAGLVTAVDISAKTITVTNGLSGPAAIHHRVSRNLGAAIAMPVFNAVGAVVGTFDWGFRGTLPDTQAGVEIGVKVRGEIILDGGAGLKLTETFDTWVTGGT